MWGALQAAQGITGNAEASKSWLHAVSVPDESDADEAAHQGAAASQQPWIILCRLLNEQAETQWMMRTLLVLRTTRVKKPGAGQL